MPLHGARADEQLAADLLVGVPVSGQLGDLGLLGREFDERLDRALAYGFAGGQQLATGAFCEGLHADRGQHLVRGAQLLACLDPAIFAPEPFAVDQMRAGQFRADGGTAEPLDRLTVQAIGRLASAQKRSGPRRHPEPPVAATDAAGLRQPPHGRVAAGASPFAEKVGNEMFAAGGSAIDAAIAAAFAAGVTGLNDVGIGGYAGSAVIYHAATKKIAALDFNSAAPKSAKPDMFTGNSPK